jgi:stearoyl-CoA desaturase (Delta-9 desaturase)
VTESSAAPRDKDWINILFLTLTPVVAFPVLAWHTWYTGFEWWMPALFLVMYCLVGLSVCAGYHRYYSHKSYECAWPIQLFLAVFGAMAAQNSILRWSSGHRRHHAYPEMEWDPYSIKRGFWWAHFIWVFYDTAKTDNLDNVRDLQKSAIVQWQDRWYRALVVVAGFGIPTLIGALCGNAIAGLLWGGFLRVVLIHHSTFFVNSLAHHVGEKTYNEDSTARDNWAVALVTFGEGYHSFHHRFPSDFRNGVRWYAWDPAKWFIQILQLTGLAWKLNMTEGPQIELARIKVAAKKLEKQIADAHPSIGDEIRARIQRAQASFDCALELWRKQADERSQGLSTSWKETRRAYEESLKQARLEWREAVQACKQLASGKLAA